MRTRSQDTIIKAEEDSRVMADVSVSHEALSEYEKLRQANIERNEQFLKSLGVSHTVSSSSSSDHPTQTSHSHSHNSQTRQTKSAAKKRKSDHKNFEEVPPVESRRRSRRIQQLSAEFNESKDEEGIYFVEEVPHRASTIPVQPLELTVDDAESGGRVAVTAAQIQALIEKSDQNHNDLISNEVNPIIVFFMIALFTAPLFSSSCTLLSG